MVKRATPPKLPKGYEPTYTSYELITKTTYDRPYKPLKAARKLSKAASSKEYVQKVQVVNLKALNKGKSKGYSGSRGR